MALGQLRPRAWRACSSEVWRLLLGDSALGTGRQVLRPNPSAGCLYEGRSLGCQRLSISSRRVKGSSGPGEAVITCSR